MNKKDLIIYIILAYLLYNHFFCKETFSLESGKIPGNLSIDGDLYVKGGADIKKTLGVHGMLYGHGGGEFDGNLDYSEKREAIINLNKLAKNLTKDGKLVVPGGLEVKGKLVVEHPQTSNTNDFALEVVGRSSLSNNSIQFVKDEKQGGTILLAGNDWKTIQPYENNINFGSAGVLCNELGVTGKSNFANGTAQIIEGKDKKYPYGIIFLKGPNTWTSINPNENNNLAFSTGVDVVGNITSAKQSVLKSRDTIEITNTSGTEYLDKTTRGYRKADPSNFKGWTYWRRYGDDDSSLMITKL